MYLGISQISLSKNVLKKISDEEIEADLILISAEDPGMEEESGEQQQQQEKLSGN